MKGVKDLTAGGKTYIFAFYTSWPGFKLSNKQLQTSDLLLYNIDQEGRLLLREIAYSSIISSYLERVVSDEDKTETLTCEFHCLSRCM